jgi:hypothetical protein
VYRCFAWEVLSNRGSQKLEQEKPLESYLKRDGMLTEQEAWRIPAMHKVDSTSGVGI